MVFEENKLHPGPLVDDKHTYGPLQLPPPVDPAYRMMGKFTVLPSTSSLLLLLKL